MVKALFDDHYEAFPTWREAGLSGLTCVHVDAHLDVMAEGFTKESLDGIARATTREELEVYRGNPRLPWGGFHCGNYLYPALKDGTVRELIWVVPPHLLAGETVVDGARQETQNWLDLRLDEYASLKGKDGAIVGVLEGVKFTICTAENLPKLSAEQLERLVLDIDIDYFIRNSDDTIWQTPHQLYETLNLPEPVALTVAYSVDGGYTPTKDRFLGRVTLDLFGGNDGAWRQETERLIEIDSLEKSAQVEALTSFLEEAPDWLRPAVLLRLGRADEAAQEDPEYAVRFENIVARHLIKKEYDKGIELMAQSDEDSTESHYLRGYLSIGGGDPLNAKRSFTKLLDNGELAPLERSRILVLKANTCLDLGEARLGLKLADEALKIEPESAEIHYLRSDALKMLGDLQKAARALRKALRFSEGRVSWLDYALSGTRLYDELGQAALARALRRELKDRDVTGRYAIQTVLDESKL